MQWILWVDDGQAAYPEVVTMCETAGASVRNAYSIQQALSILDNAAGDEPAVILLDIILPLGGYSGEGLRHVKDLGRQRRNQNGLILIEEWRASCERIVVLSLMAEKRLKDELSRRSLAFVPVIGKGELMEGMDRLEEEVRKRLEKGACDVPKC